MTTRIRIITALLGLSSVSVFVVSFLLFAALNHDFNIAGDYISKLGAPDQPFAIWWNFIGFATVGTALATFGWLFGLCRNDRVLGACLMVSGIGFALAAVPTDFTDANAPLSKAHYASICFALAGWCCGLARLLGDRSANDFAQTTAGYSVALALLPMICISGGVSAEPIAQRIVLVVVFAWVVLNSVQLLRQKLTPGIAR